MTQPTTKGSERWLAWQHRKCPWTLFHIWRTVLTCLKKKKDGGWKWEEIYEIDPWILRCVPVKNHDHTKRYRQLIAWAFSKEKMPVRKATQRSFQVDLTMKCHQTLRFKMFHLQECTFLGMIAPRRLVWKIQHWRCRNYGQERKAKIHSILHHVNFRRTIFWNARYCPPIPYRVSLCTTVVR